MPITTSRVARPRRPARAGRNAARCGRRPPARPGGGRGPGTSTKPLTRSTSCAADRGGEPGAERRRYRPPGRARRRSCRNRRGRARLRARAATAATARSSSAAAASPSATAGGTLPCSAATSLTPGRSRASISARSAARRGGVEQIGLVQDHEIGAGELVGEHLLERVVVVDRRVGAALPRDRLGSSAKRPGRDRRRVDHRDDAVDGHAGADLGPGEGLHQRLRQRQAGGLDDDMVGRLGAVDQPGQGRQEIVGDGAAQAAIGQLDDVVVGASRVAAAEQQLAVDAELAELVDDDGQPVPGGGGQQMPHQARLAGAEKAGDDRRGDAAHRLSASFSTSGRPAATNTTRSASAAMSWFSRPAASRNRRPSGVSGTSPSPTSLATSTTGPAASRSAAHNVANSSSSRASGEHQVGQPQGQAIDQHRAIRPCLCHDRLGQTPAAPRRCARTGRAARDARRCAPPSRRRPASAVAQ